MCQDGITNVFFKNKETEKSQTRLPRHLENARGMYVASMYTTEVKSGRTAHPDCDLSVCIMYVLHPQHAMHAVAVRCGAERCSCLLQDHCRRTYLFLLPRLQKRPPPAFGMPSGGHAGIIMTDSTLCRCHAVTLQNISGRNPWLLFVSSV